MGWKEKQYLKTSPYISIFLSSNSPRPWELKHFYWAPYILLIQNCTSVRVRSPEPLRFSLPAFQYGWKVNDEYLFNTNDPLLRTLSDVISSASFSTLSFLQLLTTQMTLKIRTLFNWNYCSLPYDGNYWKVSLTSVPPIVWFLILFLVEDRSGKFTFDFTCPFVDLILIFKTYS